KEKKEVIFDASPSKQCKWMGLKDNVLFWAIGESPKSKKPEALLLSETKNFATELYAYDLEKNALLWKNNSIGKAERRTICANGEKLFFCDSKKRAVCLDAKTGKELWSVNKEFDAREIGGMDWWMMASNMNAALCTKAAYYLFPMENSMLTAFSAADGRLLFETKRKSYSYLMMEKNKLLSGGGLLYDGQTGKEEKPTWGWRCGPGEVCGHKTATPNGIFKLFGAAWDLENDTAPAAAPVRSACGPGTFVANGVYYAFPNGCFCLYNWRGVIAQSSTETALPAPSKETEALETFPEAGKADEGITGTDEKDWHTYRGNNQRTGAVKAVVPAKASMAWKQLPEKPLKSGDFDNTDEAVSVPVTAGDLVVYGGFDGMLRCYSISSGRSIWNFPAEGRIFGAPSIYEGRVYAGSADGNVYCLGLTSGRLLWRFRAAPADRKILVYGNLMSSWPVNTGILLQDGLVYFSAGLIAEHGTYLYALEAKTGKVKWKVFDTGLKGLASMGHMAVIGKKLLLNGGNAPLGLFDLKNGELKRHVNMAEVSRFNTTRGKEVGVFLDRFILHGGRMLYKDENDFTESREGRAGIAFPFIEYDIKNEKTLPVELNPFQGNLSFAPPAWDSSGFLFASMINNSDTLQYLDSGKFAAALSSGLSGAVTDKKDKKYVYSAKKSIAGNGQDEAKAFLWSFDGNENYAAASICLAENAAVFTYTTKTSLKSDKYWFAAAINRVDGKQLWEEKLPGAPVLGGTAVSRDGSVLVTLRNGGIICIRK
ncbi:MAG: PQQ-binding-like beta-propeller repeat protein, partial [Candidatus Firestonebacteria bacterium]